MQKIGSCDFWVRLLLALVYAVLLPVLAFGLLATARVEAAAIYRSVGTQPWPEITRFMVRILPNYWWLLGVLLAMWALVAIVIIFRKGWVGILVISCLGNSIAVISLALVYIAVRAPLWSAKL